MAPKLPKLKPSHIWNPRLGGIKRKARIFIKEFKNLNAFQAEEKSTLLCLIRHHIILMVAKFRQIDYIFFVSSRIYAVAVLLMFVLQYTKDWFTPPSWLTFVLSIMVFLNVPFILFRKQITHSLAWRAAKKNPDSFITMILIDTIWELEHYPQKWSYLSFRKELISNISLCSIFVEKYICRYVANKESTLGSWFKQATRGISAKLREKEMWLLTPTIETPACLNSELAFFLKHFVLGNWDLLPRDQKSTHDDRWLNDKPVLRVILSFAIALLPLGMLFGLQLSPLALENPIRDFASAIAILWAVYAMFDTWNLSLTSRFASWLQSLSVMSRLTK